VTLRFLRLLRLAFWRAFQHDAFSIAKACAYSSILTFFPLLLVVGSVLASFREGQVYMHELTIALGSILPTGSATATAFLKGSTQHSTSLLVTTSLLALWTGSGVMVSWMDGFRRSYELPKIWGLFKERMISFALVILAGIPLMFATILVASGSNIERTILFHMNHEFGFYVLLMWSALRWLIATLTSIAVIALIYHNAVPRTQRYPCLRLVFAALRQLQHHVWIAGSSHRPAGLDVPDLPGRARGRGIQRHAVPTCHAGKRADRSQRAQGGGLGAVQRFRGGSPRFWVAQRFSAEIRLPER
jgi:uncharacterized BrkB/YihY/UPF0761 family membrane protein